MYDTSKQGLAAGSEHFINLLLATLFGGDEHGNACVWYFVSGFMGFAFGTPFAYVVLRLITKTARHFNFRPLIKTGVYTDDIAGQPKFTWWAVQCATWLSIIALQRFCMAVMFAQPAIHQALGAFGKFVTGPFKDTGLLEIFVIIIVLPVMINCAEFWVQDNFLMEQDHDVRERRHSLHSSKLTNANSNNSVVPYGNLEDKEALPL